MTLLKVTKKYTNFAVNDLAALWLKRSVKHGRAANHMWIRSANPPTLRMDFLGSIAEPKNHRFGTCLRPIAVITKSVSGVNMS